MTDRRTHAPRPTTKQDEEPRGGPSQPPPDVTVGPLQRTGSSRWGDFRDWYFWSSPYDWDPYFDVSLWVDPFQEYVEFATSYHERPDADRDEELRKLGIDPETGQPVGFDPSVRGDGTTYYITDAEPAAGPPPTPPPPEPPKTGVKPKKRPRMGGLPFHMQLAIRAAQGLNPATGLPWNINPLTGQPWDFDVNRSAGDRPRYTFDVGEETRDTPDEPEKTKGPSGKNGGRRTVARGPALPPPPPEDVDLPPIPDLALQVRAEIPALPLRMTPIQIANLLQFCPPYSAQERRERGLGDLDEIQVPLDIIAEQVELLGNDLAKARASLQQRRDSVMQLVELKNDLPRAIAGLESILAIVEQEHRVRGEIAVDCRSGRCVPAASPEANDLRARLTELRRLQAEVDAAQIQESARREIAQGLEQALEDSARAEPGLELLEARTEGDDNSISKIWRLLCELRLRIRQAQLIADSARATEEALLVAETDRAVRDGGGLFGTDFALGFHELTGDAAQRQAAALLGLFRQQQPAPAFMSEDELALRWRTLAEEESNPDMHSTDTAAIASGTGWALAVTNSFLRLTEFAAGGEAIGLAGRVAQGAGQGAAAAGRRASGMFARLRGRFGRGGPPRTRVGVESKPPSDLKHFTSKAAKKEIEQSGYIGLDPSKPVYALERASVPPTRFQRLASGLPSSKLEAAVPVPQSAASAFKRPFVTGPFQALRRLAGVRYTAPGRVNLSTGRFEAASGLPLQGEALWFALDAATDAALAWTGVVTYRNIKNGN